MNSEYSLENLKAIVTSMKQAHIASGPADVALRKDRLERATRLLLENHQRIAQAISADFGSRSEFQSLTADLLTPVHSLRYAAENVTQWMAAESVYVPNDGMQAWIEPQPLGVVGIISPWNFPINLAFGPLAGVFAAGNAALLKPSELTARTSDLLAELVGRYFDPMEFGVVLGDAGVGRAFSALPFDHLVFTGSTAVGRHVMRAAAEHLVPVTLELGGKSPVVIDESADIRTAVERVLTVKTFNAGQICLSPDYVLLAKSRQEAFIAAAQDFQNRSFPTLQSNPDYTSIISDKHFQRLVQLIDDAKAKGAEVLSLAPAGEPDFDAATRKMAPHLLLNVDDSMLVMQEEIFGPLLPIIGCSHRTEPITYIHAHPRPLAAYYFGADPVQQQYFAANTTSGALVFNDIMSHASIEGLPFGGVGASGMGAYHGVHGFRRFSHAKAVVQQSQDGASGLRLRAPYAQNLTAVKAALR